MPIFELNGQKYNVEDQYIDAFTNENPEAFTLEEKEGQMYRIKAKDYKSFLDSFTPKNVNIQTGKTITGGTGTQEEANSVFDANMQRFRNGQPTQKVTTQSVIDANNQSFSVDDSEINRLRGIKDTAQKQIDEAGFFDRFFDADTRAAVAARNQAEEALETYEEAKHADEGWFDKNVLGVFRGIGDKIGDLSTWDFGASGAFSGYALKNVSDKLDRGEQLTAAEQNMLDAFGLASAVQTAYQDKVGMAYKAGGSLPESAAFMGSLMFNPAAGIGRKIAESAAKAAVKKFGTSMVSKLAKGVARVGGDALEMAVATAVPGAGRIAEDYYNRVNGQSTFDIDKNGIIRYGGQVEQEEADDAIWKAFGSQFIENYSESVGNYFAPMGTMLSNLTSKGLKAAHLGKLADVVNDISSSQFSRGLKRFKDATKFDGFVGEYLEEVAGNFMNAATVGDMNFNSPEDPRSVFNPEVNLETALSCALMSGTMYAVEAPVSIYNRRVAKKNLSEADKAASELWGDRWDDMRSQMDEADPQLLAQLLTGINNATDLSDEAKQAAKNYATRLMQMQGYNARRLQNQMESTEEANAINNAYDEGTELETPYDKHNAKRAVDRAEAALGVGSENADEQLFAQMVMAGANSPVETINAMAEQGYSDEQIQKAKDYYTAYHRMNGLTDALLDNVDSQIESANREVDANTNKDNGSVTKVVLRDGRTGYIVEGTVARGEKGVVDVNNSDETVMVRLENGEVKMMNPNKDLYGVVWIDSPENVKEEINVVLREKLIDKAIGEIDWNPATPNTKVGDSFEMEGVPLTIVSHDGNDGMFVVPTEEYQSAVGSEKKMQELIAKAQQTQPIPASEYKNWASAQLDAQEEAAKVQQTNANNLQTESQTESSMSEIPTNSVFKENLTTENRPMSEEEAATFIFQMERNAVEAPEIELTPENWIAEFGEDGLVETPIGQVKFGRNQYVKLQQMGRRGKLGMIKPTLTEPDVIVEDKRPSKDGSEERDFSYVFIKAFTGKDGKRMYYFTSVTIKKDGSEVVISNQEKSLNKISRLLQGGNVVWTNSLLSSHPTTRIEESVPLNDSNKPTSTDSQSAWLGINSSELSTNKDSEKNVQSQEKEQKPLHEREKEDVFHELGEKYGEKMPHKVEVTAKALADDLAKAQKKLDKAIEEYDNAPIGREEKAEKARDKAQEEFDAIKRQADFWAALDKEIKDEQVKPGDEVAEEILSMEEPLNGEEFAAQMLANGNIKLLQDSFASETGFGKEETKKYFGLFASSEKGGMTVQQAGERLMEMDRENGTNFFDQNDPNAGRNAIIEVLGMAKTKKDLANILPNNRAEQARKEQEAEFAAYEAWVEKNFHMSVADFEAYESSYFPDLAMSMIAEEENNDFISIFVDETINNNQDGQGIIAESEGGSEVLSETQSLQTEGTGRVEKRPEETDGGIIGENGAVPEGASGSEVEGSRAVEKAQEVLDDIKQARKEVDTHPTEAQKEAGNYKKGHVKIDGFDITIENPKGGVRSGTDKNGKEWSITMNNDYGYIRRTEAVDGDHIDVFLSDNPTEGNVFVVDQSNEDGNFDESKVMYGFSSLEEAREAYLSNYENGWESRIMAITEVSKDEFKKWIDSSHRKTKAFSEYKSVKAESGQGQASVEITFESVKNLIDDYYKEDSNRVSGTLLADEHREAKENMDRIESDLRGMVKSLNDDTLGKSLDYAESLLKKSRKKVLKADMDFITRIFRDEYIDRGLTAEEQKPYIIQPATYTTKKGKVLDMFLVKPTKDEMSRERQSEARFWAKEMKGWYDRKQGGWMLRSKEDADKFVEKVFGDMQSESYDLITMKKVTDGEVSFSEPVKEDEYSPVWQYFVHVDKETGRTEITRDDVSGPIPIGDARFTIQATSPQEMLDILRNPLNGLQQALEAVEVTLENRVKTMEMDAAIKNQPLPIKEEPANPSGNKLVSDERYAELRERMRKKLGGQMNMGIDPEILAIGTEMAVYHIEKGARKFAEYAKAMIADLGDAIRPYLKAFYNGARDLPEMQNERFTSEMTPYEEVSSFDVANFDKASIDVVAAVETIAKEQEVEKQAEVAKVRVKKQSKPKKKTKENVSLLGDLFNQNIEENESNDDGRGNRQKASGTLPTNGGRKHVASTTGNQTTDESLGSQPRKEDSQSEGRGLNTGMYGRDVSDENGSDRVHGSTIEQPVKKNARNFSFGEGHIEVPSGDVAKLKANIAAIRTLKEIEASGQPATDAQKAVLAKYVGWGGLSAALDEQKFLNSKGWMSDRNWNEKYLPYYIELRELLTKEEFNDAVQSTLTSHYTPEDIIRGMWNVVEQMGFKGGRINEPAAGIGHILGLMPSSISERSIISGTELDSLSGRIAKALYPDASIKVQGYEKEFAPKSKDLVITNVPFGKTAPYDKALDKALHKKMGSAYNLHNYFIAKGLLELKEGGIGVFVTSSATMDGANSKFREWVAANGIDLIGAIRLPNNAFFKNAGTSVTADMLVFRKRKSGEPSNGVDFVSTTQVGEGNYVENGKTHTKPIMINEYFAEHPEMMLGEMMTAHDAGSGGLYSGASQTCVAEKGADLGKKLQNAIMRLDAMDGNFSESQNSIATEGQAETTDLKNGTLVVKGDDVLIAINGELQPIATKKEFTFNGKKQKTAHAVRDYIALKETLKSLIAAEQSSTENPEPIRKKLNNEYDAFVTKYGTLNRNKALDDVLAEDFEHNLPLSLENVKRVPSATGKSMVWEVTKGEGILSKRVSYPVEEPTKAENLDDAIHISRSYRGVIDVPYVAALLGQTEEEVTNDMLQEGLAYRNPITGNLEDKESYLSGNVKEKLEQARAMAEEHPEYQKNVEDLAEVQPETVRFGDISYRIGTPWIPTEYVNDFASEVLGVRSVDVQYIPELNEFVVSKSARVDDFAKSSQFRTDRVGVIDLLEYALNQRKPKIFDKHVSYGPLGKVEERVPNEAETQAAAEKIMEISDKFIEYIDGRSNIHRELERIYNDKYNNYRLKTYELPSFSKMEKDKDGKDVLATHYPNSNVAISLREHQAKAVQRCLSESTLLAHQVGTGKTFTMITAAMEMRRLGIANKPMIVVQNATLEDFVKDFYKLYPGANVLAPGKDERSAENRKRLFNLIATGDFDAIVIPQSFMQFIPDDEGRKKELIQKRIEEYERALEKIEDYSLQKRMQKEIDSLRDTLEGKEKKRSVKDSAKVKESIKAKVEKTLDRRTDEVLTFEQMGIDALFIDEAHNYKKIGFASKMSNVKGIDTSASQRANSLILKAQYVQEKNGGRNVILATGTPITNTMAEVWTMMKFVSPEILETYNIQGFDDFATTFGTVEPSLEFTATGNFKIADRFKSYVNVPELVKAFRSHADVVLTSDVKEFKESNNIPKLKDDQMTNVVIEKNEDLEDVMDILIKKLEEYNEMSGSEKREWSALPLVVFSRAKQAAIDLRLLNPSYEDNPNSKTNHVVRNVLNLYQESTPEKGAQMIFCDSYQSPGEAPKMDLFDYDPDVPRFNLYEDIKKKLVEGGIPANEIAIVNNYDGERRKQLFEKVRNGDVRVLLGSTEKMGVGVNVQDRMFALHHIDAPIRPMDFEQRNGRILRQGNLYAIWGKPVNVVTYGVQGTLDATAYDRLRVKQDFINQMMKGDVSGRIMEEQDEEDPSGMTFNQMAATLSGDKTAQILFVAENELKKLRNLKRSDFNSKSGMGMTIQSEERRLVTLNDKLELWGKAKEITSKYFPEGVTEVKVNGETFTEKLGPSLDPVIENYEEAYSLNRGIAPLKISLNNGNGEVIVHFDEGKMVYELYAGKEHMVESRQFNGGKGLMSSIEHQLKATEKNYNETKQKISETKNKIQGLEKAMNAPWGREEELKKKEQEVAELKKQLEEKALENSKNKPVEQPKNEVAVDSDKEVLYRVNANFRSGEGALTADEVSMANDPIGKVLGYSTRTAGERKTFAERVRMVQRVNSLAKKLGLKNVEIVLDGNTLKGKKAKAKGFYSRTNRKITIVISNHTSVFDVEQTLLHEAVAHYGLRELFGPQFDVFLDNVYRHAASDVRERINRLAEKNGWDFRTATEEYLASLAEDTNFENMDESWWGKIKEFFLDMLHQIGFNEFRGVTLTDNELRYILWRSYENLAEPGSRRSIFGEATDVVMQNKLKVGNYSYLKYEHERDRLLATGRTNSRVAEGDAYTYTPEDVIQEFEEVVANHSDIYAIRTEEDIDALPTDRYTKRDIKSKFNNPRVTGTHVEGGMMILFVDRMDEAELRATIPHELAHYASRNLKFEESYKMSVLSYLQKHFPNSYKKVQEYPREKWGEEAVSHLFEEKVKELGFEKILNGKFDTHNDIGYIFYNITNYLNHGKRNNPLRYGERPSSQRANDGKGNGLLQETGVFGNAGLRIRKETEGSVSGNDGRRSDSELGAVSGSSMGIGYESRARQEEVEDELYRIDDEVEGMADNTARKLYEDSINGKGYRFQEGFQDSMLSLKKLQEAIVKQHGGKLEEWEDAYTAENQMSSRDTSEIENFVFNHFKPMMNEVANVLKRGGMTYEELRTYLFAKSGLERNRDFAVRDAIAQREKDGDDVSGIYEAYMQRKQELLQDLKDGTISFREYCEEMDNEAMMIAPDLMGKDYSGLSSLFSEDNFTEDAIAEVESVEDFVDTSDLWNVIKGATQFTLDRAKQSGVMNTDVHKKLSEMFEWYIPMRGWSETKARDVYEYFGSQEGVFNPSVKNAYGRKSLADDPLATISNMAESAIFQGNKNQMKQKLLNLAFDKPTNLITVMDSWIENKGTDTDPRWEYAYPTTIEEDDDADVIAAKIKLFEEEMEQKKDEGRAKKLRGKADVPYIATPKEIVQHIIRVKRNGREFVMILNGNPRAAQAVNGMTNPETYNGIIEQVSRKLNRFMAAAFTTKNPTFIMRNLSRDLIFSNTAVAVKENTAYGKKFRGNQLKVLGNMRGLMKRYQSGNLDMSNELDKMFMEFIKNGGETGFAQLTSVDEYKKKIQRELNIAKNGGAINKGKKVGRAVMDTIEFYNRCAEDVSRFTVFMTSRQMGRSIQRSISDAKEITVNFNKRGSGSKAGGFIGFGAQSMRSLYLFFNAAVQALVNFKRLGQKHPVAFTSALSMYAVSGFLMPVVNEFLSSILGGDDDDYENLPEWVRRNNLVISLGKWGGDSMFLTIPLPIEMRAFYGLGETANQMMAGNVRGKDAALQVAGQFAEMLPLNFVTDAAGPWNAFTPDAFKPIVQAYIANKDWTGKPIYRDNGFNKELPEWTKAYAGTSKWLVNSSELMNEFTGGDKYKSGVVDANPARLEHLFTGYLGGFGDMFLGAYKTLSMPFDEDYRNVRHVPVLKAFLNQSDERTSYSQVKKDYASYKHEYEDTVRRLNGYEKELNRPETAMEYAERMDFLYRSPQMKRYEIMREYERELSKMYKMMQEYPDSDIQKSIMVSINQLKANAVERLRNIE